ncbi:MAG: ArsR/SmtB family transcription factor [Angustibacter sp.]
MDAFEGLADPVRRTLLLQLSNGPTRVVDLAQGHLISRPAISRHLRGLTQAGLVIAHAHGRERHYQLDHAGIEAVRDWLDQLYQPTGSITNQAMDALATEVRRTVRDQPTTTHTHPEEETA